MFANFGVCCPWVRVGSPFILLFSVVFSLFSSIAFMCFSGPLVCITATRMSTVFEMMLKKLRHVGHRYISWTLLRLSANSNTAAFVSVISCIFRPSLVYSCVCICFTLRLIRWLKCDRCFVVWKIVFSGTFCIFCRLHCNLMRCVDESAQR